MCGNWEVLSAREIGRQAGENGGLGGRVERGLAGVRARAIGIPAIENLREVRATH